VHARISVAGPFAGSHHIVGTNTAKNRRLNCGAKSFVAQDRERKPVVLATCIDAHTAGWADVLAPDT